MQFFAGVFNDLRIDLRKRHRINLVATQCEFAFAVALHRSHPLPAVELRRSCWPRFRRTSFLTWNTKSQDTSRGRMMPVLYTSTGARSKNRGFRRAPTLTPLPHQE